MKQTPGFTELLAYAEAEEIMHNTTKYEPDELARLLNKPAEFVNLDAFLSDMRRKALALAKNPRKSKVKR